MDTKSKRIRSGYVTIGALAVLTAVEYIISISMSGTVLYLSVIAVAKAGLILNHFMHVAQVRYQEGGH